MKESKNFKSILIILLILVLVVIGVVIALNSKDKKDTNTTENNSIKIEESQNNEFSCFEQFKNTEYRGQNGADSCVLKFDKNGKPSIDIRNATESYGTAEEFTNILADVAAGSTYVTFNFTGKAPNGNAISGNGTIKYSNVSEESSITVTLNYSTGVEKTIDVSKK